MTTANISPKDVMKLRDRTGLGMGDCKSALTESNGDIEAAEKLLREKMKGVISHPTDFVQLDIGDGVSMDAWILKPKDFDPYTKEVLSLASAELKCARQGPAGGTTP